jgi:hypothetical protein
MAASALPTASQIAKSSVSYVKILGFNHLHGILLEAIRLLKTIRPAILGFIVMPQTVDTDFFLCY